MKNIITSLLLATSLTFTLVACGGGHAEKLAALATEACACQDMKCHEAVEKKADAIREELNKEYPKIKDAPADLLAAVHQSLDKSLTCREELAKNEKK